ncbi:MAG TPA: signal peptidase I [Candidatus Levybacteria bacterium]|nr:signal peptidase I [Candidatus Levybacteria bacterium]
MKKHLRTTGKVTKKILHIKLTLLVLMILPLAVFTLLTSKSALIAGIRSMVVLSGSMEPAVQTGSVVYVQPSNSYNVGDIVTFNTQSGMTVTHRIVSEELGDNGMTYTTKGDANNTADSESVSQSQIMGKSLFSIPYLGYVVNFLKTPKGFLLAIILPTLIFIGFELWAIKKEIEKNVEKKVLARMQKTAV